MVDAELADPEVPLDRLAPVVDVDPLSVHRPGQVVLRKRWSLVRPLGLGADHAHPAIEVLLAQGLDCAGSGETATHDDVRRFGARGHDGSS